MAGLPKSYIKKYGITKKAWREFRASKKSKSSSKSKTKKSNPKKNVNRMGRKRGSVPLAVVGGAVAGMVIPTPFTGDSVLGHAKAGNWQNAGKAFVESYTGIQADGKWHPMNAHGVKALIAGALVHKFVGGWPINVNRYLRGLPVKI